MALTAEPVTWRTYALVMRGDGTIRYLRVGYARSLAKLVGNLARILPGPITKVHALPPTTRDVASWIYAGLLASVPADHRARNGWCILNDRTIDCLPIWWGPVLRTACGDAWPWTTVDVSACVAAA